MQFVLLSATEIQVELCRRLKKRRLAKNISQESFACKVGVSTKTINNLEKDGRCTLDTFIRCLMALGLVHELDSILKMEVASIAQIELAEKPLRQRARKPKGI
jgi:transcriptional regulator with XRE-family HTH domain